MQTLEYFDQCNLNITAILFSLYIIILHFFSVFNFYHQLIFIVHCSCYIFIKFEYFVVKSHDLSEKIMMYSLKKSSLIV